MTYVVWHQRPEHIPPTATVSKPPDDPKALAKQFAGTPPEIEYTPDEHTTNIRVDGNRHRRI
jgi:hypothetical protein